MIVMCLQGSPVLATCVTKSATIQIAIADVAIRHGNEAMENNPTEGKLVGAPRIDVVDALNTDPANNRLRTTWRGVFLNLTEYQLSYTVFLVQKQTSRAVDDAP